MAIRRGTVNTATANTVATQRRNAARNRCPTCGRKSAMRSALNWDGDGGVLRYCYWAEERGMCTHEAIYRPRS